MVNELNIETQKDIGKMSRGLIPNVGSFRLSFLFVGHDQVW